MNSIFIPMPERLKGWLVVATAYAVAFALAASAVRRMEEGILAELAAAQLLAAVVFFIFSFLCNNSSLNDTYWSSAPIAFVIYYLSLSGFEENTFRKILLLIIVSFWGLRLTAYVLYYWRGLRHEDWRFVDLRKKTGSLYWAASFFGLHILPALLTYLASLSFYPVIFSQRTFGVADILAAAFVIIALAIGAVSDEQLRRFRVSSSKTSLVMTKGLWNYSRHPNYVGETLFWWGIWLMGLSSNPAWWWTVIGPLGITGLFHFASIDLMERHLILKEGYADYKSGVPRYFPCMTGIFRR